MKSSTLLKTIIISLVLSMVLSIVSPLTFFAESIEPTISPWENKISTELWQKINEPNSENEKILVWVWFTDIDQDQVDMQVKQKTGLTIDTLAVSYETPSEDLVQALQETSASMSDSIQDPINGKLAAYIEATKTQRNMAAADEGIFKLLI